MRHQPAARRSGREFLFQLSTITIGVLIALSFDGTLRCGSNRALVAEARATIVRELEENRAQLDEHIAGSAGRLVLFDTATTYFEQRLAGTPPTVSEIELGLNLPELAAASWESAERTGALALMDYSEACARASICTTSSRNSCGIPTRRAPRR